ncbi:DUF2232 domain-containing protein [Staphylococcus coagulans]|uniref:DUF2232 domain-containing protein n=1 Tax=Staphylococcus coagulans TaxID=74706 RepID=UPI001F38B90E
MASLFSKIKPKETLIGTIALLAVALVLHFMPWSVLIIACFATLPGIILWYRSMHSFGLATLITILLSTLTGDVFVMTFMIILLALSAVIAQLLKQRASKEHILYVATLVTSIITIGAIMILQGLKQLPYAQELLEPYQKIVNQMIEMQNLDQQAIEVLNNSVHQLAVQLPAMIVVTIAIYLIVTLMIIFPILRKFKIATPVFRPLYLWQMKRSLFIIYAIALLVSVTTEPATTINSIGINFQIVLGFLLVIQGLSFIYYFTTIKRMPVAVSVIFIVLGIIFYPMTRLIGLLDLGLNLKSMIKNDKR